MEDVVILCAVGGARLREHTEAIPKPLVEIGGGPSSGT
jgi:NDP-sugar pyrophosphorylase family protein